MFEGCSIPQSLRLLLAGLVMLVYCIITGGFELLCEGCCLLFENSRTVLYGLLCAVVLASFVPMLVALSWLIV